ncbi:hypothetical protein DUI87_27014 [Hirundo rustica rustica]|uniref:Uncharacterized protein n=1 Tax=Hirundo rustica rustica TaxID=333673 RepID=A0A3M0J6L4_HIRRU|nr:hypothetical protein DUI87_27014 [Hirundo rustica rustica]
MHLQMIGKHPPRAGPELQWGPWGHDDCEANEGNFRPTLTPSQGCSVASQFDDCVWLWTLPLEHLQGMECWSCPQPWCHRGENLGAASTVMSQRGERWGCATPGPAPRALAAPGGDTKAELGGRQRDHGVQAPALHRQTKSGSLGILLERCPKAPGAAAASEL